ncbi:hypothetical protein ACQ661_07560 [Pseudidiomarina sp. WS423]|uniref:hypothetical protein n=1 Tax=Pseudidiomarina sp. WS423 TaxID=3425124 RepID=UPI003D6FBE19
MTNSITALDIAKYYEKEQQQIHNFLMKYGIHVGHEKDTFHAISADDGTYSLRPYPEFNVSIFRGQSESYPSCIPSLARRLDSIERLVAVAYARHGEKPEQL